MAPSTAHGAGKARRSVGPYRYAIAVGMVPVQSLLATLLITRGDWLLAIGPALLAAGLLFGTTRLWRL